MSVSRDDSEALGKLDQLTDNERNILDQAFKDMYYRAGRLNLPLAGDDRSAALEAAFIRFLLASRPA